MSMQLDILALEPFFGGVRRIMLETLVRYSRHRWTVLKLPPRRIERRLSAAAIWFAEQLSRHWVSSTDLLFTSEAMNLSDLYRLHPKLRDLPSVVYFHDNQLPEASRATGGMLDLVNLSSALAASEIWFNSLFHLKSFLTRGTGLVRKFPELATQNPMPEVTRKARLMPPPIDLRLAPPDSANVTTRQKRRIFVETRDADIDLLNDTLATLMRRGERFELVTVGPVDGLIDDLPRTTIPEQDELAQCQALAVSGVFFSTRHGATVDHHALRALAGGCWPLCPRIGVYPEYLPPRLHDACLHEGRRDMLAGRLQDVWHMEMEQAHEAEQQEILRAFEPLHACRQMDDRLEELKRMHR